jgi:mannose-1-phosphate guanylyltransferase
MAMINTALILAGGLGTRLRPLTLTLPKALVPIDEANLTEHVIEKLKEAGVKKIYLSIGYLADKITGHFDKKNMGLEIKYIVEKEPLGTGGCMHLVDKEDFSSDFIVVNGDNLFDLDWRRMLDTHKNNNSIITIALTKVEDVTDKGVVALDRDKILRFVEKPRKEEAPSNYINSGYYIFSPEIFNHLPKQERFMFERDLFPAIAEQGRLHGYIDSGQWFDTGTLERLEEVRKKWKKI